MFAGQKQRVADAAGLNIIPKVFQIRDLERQTCFHDSILPIFLSRTSHVALNLLTPHLKRENVRAAINFGNVAKNQTRRGLWSVAV